MYTPVTPKSKGSPLSPQLQLRTPVSYKPTTPTTFCSPGNVVVQQNSTCVKPPTVIGAMIHRMVSEKVGGATTRTRSSKEATVSTAESQKRLEAVIRGMWAESTLNDRQNLWRRLHTWTSTRGLPIDAVTATMFCMATGVAPQGQLAYVKTFSAILGKMGLDNSPLLTTASALRASGAAIPNNQDVPIPKQVLLRWAAEQEPSLRLCTFIAWKTASRWGEVWKLNSIQFLLASPEEVIIDWWTTPKARRRDPFRASRFVVIKGHLTDEIASLFQSLQPFTVLCSVTTAQLDALWCSDASMNQYRAHSIKRGATSHLMEKQDEGVVIPGELLDRLTKHEHGTEKVSPATLRYGANPIATARYLDTAKVTQHL